MRLKAGKTTYTLPKGITPNLVYLEVGKNWFHLQQVSNPRDLPRVKIIEPYPAAWCYLNPHDDEPAQIEIAPKPAKAWRLRIQAFREVIV